MPDSPSPEDLAAQAENHRRQADAVWRAWVAQQAEPVVAAAKAGDDAAKAALRAEWVAAREHADWQAHHGAARDFAARACDAEAARQAADEPKGAPLPPTADDLKAERADHVVERAEVVEALEAWLDRADQIARSAAKRAQQGKAALVSESKALDRARREAAALNQLLDDMQPIRRLDATERFPLT